MKSLMPATKIQGDAPTSLMRESGRLRFDHDALDAHGVPPSSVFRVNEPVEEDQRPEVCPKAGDLLAASEECRRGQKGRLVIIGRVIEQEPVGHHDVARPLQVGTVRFLGHFLT
jgi:hypothetical protein